MEELQRKLEETSMLCQSLLGENQPVPMLGRQAAAGKSIKYALNEFLVSVSVVRHRCLTVCRIYTVLNQYDVLYFR